MVKIITDVKYRLINLYSGTYMTLAGDKTAIIGQAYSTGNNQLWTFVGSGTSGVYYIQSVDTKEYAGVLSSQIAENTQIMGIAGNFGWKAVGEPDMGAGTKFAVSSNTSLYMDLKGGSDADGTPVILFHETGDNQIWVLAQAE